MSPIQLSLFLWRGLAGRDQPAVQGRDWRQFLVWPTSGASSDRDHATSPEASMVRVAGAACLCSGQTGYANRPHIESPQRQDGDTGRARWTYFPEADTEVVRTEVLPTSFGQRPEQALTTAVPAARAAPPTLRLRFPVSVACSCHCGDSAR